MFTGNRWDMNATTELGAGGFKPPAFLPSLPPGVTLRVGSLAHWARTRLLALDNLPASPLLCILGHIT